MFGKYLASRHLSAALVLLGITASLGGCATTDSAAHFRSSIDNEVWNGPASRRMVAWNGKEKPGTVVIDTRERTLTFVQKNRDAIQYAVGVGREGFQWSGYKYISEKKIWPGWTPPEQMHARQKGLPNYMVGGVQNPLGARAMYLGSSLYRIHGTSDPETIGQAVSSGCIRMNNADVMDLFERVHVGTPVVVKL
jgi:lipoprotein-anchoring transpeptidase ErfK/SrfK